MNNTYKLHVKEAASYHHSDFNLAGPGPSGVLEGRQEKCTYESTIYFVLNQSIINNNKNYFIETVNE